MEQKYRLEMPPLLIDKRGNRGAFLIEQAVGDMTLQYHVKIEKTLFESMTPAQLKKVREMADREIKRRKKK